MSSAFKQIIMMGNQTSKKHNRVFWNQQVGLVAEAHNCFDSYNSDTNAYMVIPTTADVFGLYVKNDYVYGEFHKKLIIVDYDPSSSMGCYVSVRTCDSNGNITGSTDLTSWLSPGTHAIFLTTGYIGTTDYSFSQIGFCGESSGGFGYFMIANIRCYDLTLMFGAGNEPSTEEEFYQRINGIPIDDLNAYNSGQWVEWDTP